MVKLLILDIKNNRLTREYELTQNETDVLKVLGDYRIISSSNEYFKDKKISKKALTNIIHKLREEKHIDIETKINSGYLLDEIMYIDF